MRVRSHGFTVSCNDDDRGEPGERRMISHLLMLGGIHEVVDVEVGVEDHHPETETGSQSIQTPEARLSSREEFPDMAADIQGSLECSHSPEKDRWMDDSQEWGDGGGDGRAFFFTQMQNTEPLRPSPAFLSPSDSEISIETLPRDVCFPDDGLKMPNHASNHGRGRGGESVGPKPLFLPSLVLPSPSIASSECSDFILFYFFIFCFPEIHSSAGHDGGGELCFWMPPEHRSR